MKKEDHFLLTIPFSLFIYYYFFNYEIYHSLIASFLTAFFSWLPDLDIKIQKKIEKTKKKKKIVYFLFLPFFLLFKKILQHRGLTHSIYLPILLIYLDFLIKDYLISFFVKVFYISIILHIFEDSLTKTGVRIFYPVSFRLKIPIYSTNNYFHSILIKIKSIILTLLFFLSIK